MGDTLSCSAGYDCTGTCGGSAVVDECGECGGDGKPDGWSSCFFEESIDYSTDIQPIFNTYCTGCHGVSGELNLTSYSKLMDGGTSGSVVILENGAGSLIIKKLRNEDIPAMPYNNCCIDATLINKIEAWIDEGASQ